jgi:hypothetical protein
MRKIPFHRCGDGDGEQNCQFCSPSPSPHLFDDPSYSSDAAFWRNQGDDAGTDWGGTGKWVFVHVDIFSISDDKE